MIGRRGRTAARARIQVVVAIAAAATVASALLASSAVAEPAPDGLPAFYATPDKLPTKPGTLIKSEKVKAPDVDGTVYRVMYVSENQQGKPAAVTGVVVIPAGKAPKGGFPVVTWAHGTDGMADTCAASLEPEEAAPAANELLAQGWAITASDYEGEGTPGLHPYIAGKNAARNAIDIVRAAKQLKGADLSDQYVVWGHSQGGHTAMHASQLAPDYAPELDLKGTVAGAPPSQFNLLYNFLKTSDFRYYLLMASGGLNAAYGDKDAPLDEVLTPAGEKLVPELDKVCASELRDKFGATDFDTVTKTDPFTVPKWKKILTNEDPQNFATGSEDPVLIIHGGADEQIPTASSALLFDQLCGVGQNLERWVYPGQKHADVITPSLPDMIHWIGDRFAANGRETTTDPYAPTGQPDVEVTRCPS
jgi:dipeptidyl aminopeptidase/acylaminoacyl peptidase